jgi:hypothetical protein
MLALQVDAVVSRDHDKSAATEISDRWQSWKALKNWLMTRIHSNSECWVQFPKLRGTLLPVLVSLRLCSGPPHFAVSAVWLALPSIFYYELRNILRVCFVGRGCRNAWDLANRARQWWPGGTLRLYWVIYNTPCYYLSFLWIQQTRRNMYTCLFFTLHSVPPLSELCFRLPYCTTSVHPRNYVTDLSTSKLRHLRRRLVIG